MEISLLKHRRLLIHEHQLQEDGFAKIMATSAIQLREMGKLYLAQLAGFDETRGNIILRLSSKRPFPRKNEHLTAFIPAKTYTNPQHWQSESYSRIRTTAQRFCELTPVWFQFEENDRLIIGFRGATASFMENLPRNVSIVLGPQEPPSEYLRNLIFLLDNAPLYPRFQETVSLDVNNNDWQPESLQNDAQTSLLLSAQLAIHQDVLIQGPPGTGKSFLIANLCADYLRQGKRVLVTALTNTALTELADKEGLTDFIKAEKIYKTSLTTDESKRIPKLKDGSDFNNEPGTLLLTSYYKLSDRTKTATGSQFDLVIIEEASQAFLATIGAARHLGEHCVVVGDQMQLQPIRHLNDEDLEDPNLVKAFNGLDTVANSRLTTAKYILEQTFRLPIFSTYLTNSFYNDRLSSSQQEQKPLQYPVNTELLFMHQTAHCIELTMQAGVKTPNNAINAVTKMAGELHQLNPKASIAVLSFYVATVKELQQRIYAEVGYSEYVLVETIDRIQGLTIDVCLLLIPNTGLSFSFNPNRFNVATSRARQQTILYIPTNLNTASLDRQVNVFLARLKEGN